MLKRKGANYARRKGKVEVMAGVDVEGEVVSNDFVYRIKRPEKKKQRGDGSLSVALRHLFRVSRLRGCGRGCWKQPLA